MSYRIYALSKFGDRALGGIDGRLNETTIHTCEHHKPNEVLCITVKIEAFHFISMLTARRSIGHLSSGQNKLPREEIIISSERSLFGLLGNPCRVILSSGGKKSVHHGVKGKAQIIGMHPALPKNGSQ